jgi:sporulation protein YlmC with PRC-barrel domain
VSGSREVRLELLIGRQVHALNGRPVGRVEEVLASPQGKGWVVREYHIGGKALLERLAAPLTGGARPRGFRVPWDKLDLSDPLRPKLSCPLEDLERL